MPVPTRKRRQPPNKSRLALLCAAGLALLIAGSLVADRVAVSGSNLRRGGLTIARGQADLYESVVATGAGMEVTIGGRDLTTPATRTTGAGPHTDHCGGN